MKKEKRVITDELLEALRERVRQAASDHASIDSIDTLNALKAAILDEMLAIEK